MLDTAAGRLFLKPRNPRCSAPEMLPHGHALMEHLAARSLCTPSAILSQEGGRWVDSGGGRYELYPYLPGEPHDPTSEAQVRDAGRALARFHHATDDFRPSPGKNWPRYHAPSLTIEALPWTLAELADCESCAAW